VLSFVDLPGFGYAKLSKGRKSEIECLAERYLAKSRAISLVVLLVDARREVAEEDKAVLAALYDMGLSVCVVATKIDKIGKDWSRERDVVSYGLGLPEGQPLGCSSKDGRGVRELWGVIRETARDLTDRIKGEDEGGEGEGRIEDGEGGGEEYKEVRYKWREWRKSQSLMRVNL
jgi:GTP-binding protein EngB required for normal cell division